MFRDECEIEVAAGKGGDGAVSFHREKLAPLGGPDGGDGGKGGDVVLWASERVNSLLAVGRQPRYAARKGQPGGSSDKSGHGGADLVLEVPVGTQVYDKKHGHLLADLDVAERRLVIALGGRGGRGNASFKNAVHQAPRHAEQGQPGEHRLVRLELKLFAEVGLLGLPNAGKSTFLARVSRATPKIADYPFTTLGPQVGIATVGDHETLVIADLPGLIEGAAEGAGLGHRFLKHVERCRVLLQLIDVSSHAHAPPEEALRVVEGELERYSPELARRPRLIGATKVEDEESRAAADRLEEAAGRPVHRISSVLGEGVEPLLNALFSIVRGAPVGR
jgi:GTP-binding protein